MGFDIASEGANLLNTGINTVLGLALEKHNDQRQLQQQGKLQQMQIAGQKEMADYSYEKQMQMWQNTSYPAQVKMLEQAGLNPALMYGQGGGGGVTTGTAPTTSVTSGDAPKGGHEVIDAQQTGMGIMQMQMMAAQIKNIEADTANKEADTTNKPLQGEAIKATTENTKANTALTNLNTQWQNATYYNRIDLLDHTINILAQEETQAELKTGVDQDTYNTRVETIQQDLINKTLEAALQKANITKTETETKAVSEGIQQKWKALNQTDTQNAIQQFKAEMDAAYPSTNHVIGKGLNDLIEEIFNLGKQKFQKPLTTVPNH